MRLKLVLGSASPRRRALLAQIGLVPDSVRPPDIDETPRPDESPRDYCRRIVSEKIASLPAEADEVVLCADTTVALGRRILGKPAGETEAAAFLRALSNRRHRVITAVAVKRGKLTWHRDVTSQVKMKPLSEPEIAGYLATGDWHGKAGGYAIQGPAGAFVPWISGSHSAIVGLPLAETSTLLSTAGFPVWGAV